jgi:hypothetical protein
MAACTGGDEHHGPQHRVDRFGGTGEQHRFTLTRVRACRGQALAAMTAAAPTGIFR